MKNTIAALILMVIPCVSHADLSNRIEPATAASEKQTEKSMWEIGREVLMEAADGTEVSMHYITEASGRNVIAQPAWANIHNWRLNSKDVIEVKVTTHYTSENGQEVYFEPQFTSFKYESSGVIKGGLMVIYMGMQCRQDLEITVNGKKLTDKSGSPVFKFQFDR